MALLPLIIKAILELLMSVTSTSLTLIFSPICPFHIYLLQCCSLLSVYLATGVKHAKTMKRQMISSTLSSLWFFSSCLLKFSGHAKDESRFFVILQYNTHSSASQSPRYPSTTHNLSLYNQHFSWQSILPNFYQNSLSIPTVNILVFPSLTF